MDFNITLLPGDGIGAEVTDSAAAVLNAVERKFGHDFHMKSMPIGGAAIDMTGVPLPEDTLKACKKSNAVLMGAVGGKKWDGLKQHVSPERGLLSLRAGLGVYAGLCPVELYDGLKPLSALNRNVIKNGADILLVRELTGGIYYGEHGYRNGEFGQEAFDTEVYSINEIERVAKIAFELAMTRNKHVTNVDKSNMLYSGKLWRATVERVAKGYPEVQLDNLHVGPCAAKLISAPSEFDVILTNNMFGDILANELAAIAGSVGMLPSGAIGSSNVGLYSPVHGSAPEIAGKDEANPIGAILSAAMMLSSSLKLVNEAITVVNAVKTVLGKGLRTKDVACGKKYVSCSRMTEEIVLAVHYTKIA